MTVLTNVFNTTLYTNLNFNFVADVAHVGGVANAPYVVIVPPSFPAKTIPEFIAYAKANPGKINMASGGKAPRRTFSASCSRRWPGSICSTSRIAAST